MMNKQLMKYKDKSIFKNNNKRLKKDKDKIRIRIRIRRLRKKRWKRLIIMMKGRGKMCELKNIIKWVILLL